MELARGVAVPVVKTFETDISPFWFEEGKRIAFRRWTRGKPHVFVRSLEGEGFETELTEGYVHYVSPNNGYLILSPAGSAEWSAAYLRLGSQDTEPVPFGQHLEKLNLWNIRLSPDEQWMAYRSSVSGKSELYAATFPAGTQRKVVSHVPVEYFEWHPDGSALFYLDENGHALWSAAVELEPTFRVERPVKVMELAADLSRQGFQVGSDGQRFLMLRNLPEPPGPDGLPAPKALLIENALGAR
jgi:hypothetical protein